MSRRLRLRISKSAISLCHKCPISYSMHYHYFPRLFSTLAQESPLFGSYAKIKAHADKGKTEQTSLSSSSPLLSQLELMDSNNNLLSTDWIHDWNKIREMLNKTMMFYINDFCNDFSYKHCNNPIIGSDYVKRTQYMLLKTNIGGKNNRGILHCASLFSLRMFQKKELTASDIHNALTIAMCIEALQSYFLVLDDVMDESITRRGKPCWYRFPNVGLKAVNDGCIIENWMYWLIGNRLIDAENGVMAHRLKRLFREVTMLTLTGQSTDLETVRDAEQLKTLYTLHRYETIAMYKTAFYSFYLPYAAALYLCGYDDNGGKQINDELDMNDDVIDDGLLFHIVRQISIEFGIKFQIDDDYLDCYGDPKVTGKVGTDIEDFKCSWILVKALELMNDEQYEMLRKHYGQKNEYDVMIVKKLFKELEIENVYKNWEVDQHNKLLNMVEQCEGILPKEMFTVILTKLHNRKK